MATHPVMKIVPPYTPELLKGSQEAIEQFLLKRTSPSVLEFGAGWSTVWFAGLTDKVVSIEHDFDWLCSTSDALVAARREKNAIIRYRDVDGLAKSVGPLLPSNNYDLIYIDCVDEARLEALQTSLNLLKPDGWLVVDDSHWDMFKGLPERMASIGYGYAELSGDHTRKTGEVKFHQTTIYYKVKS